MMRSNAEIVDHLVDNLFRSSMINKDEFHRKAKQTIRKTFDVHLHPFSLNEEEKIQRTGLRSIMASTMDVSAPVRPMSKDQLQLSLHLEVPKKVIQYVASSVPIIDTSNKAKQVRQRVMRGPQRQARPQKRNMPEVASIYAEDPEVLVDDDDDGAPASKRTRMSKGGAEDLDRGRRVAAIDVEEEYEPVVRRSTPSNFYTVVGTLFDEFWAMEFDDVEVTWAFFALITNANCKDYRLDVFAEHSYSLAVIKEKLKNRAYCSLEDFVYDFNQLFTNIFTYYPESSLPYRKAVELSKLFQERWQELLPKFK